MFFEDKLKQYGELTKSSAKEEAVVQTIQMSKEAFYKDEEQQRLTYSEFLFVQFKLIRKKWWICQIMLLFVLWMLIPSLVESDLLQRGMGMMATLFVILVIPEVWKNQDNKSMEIEAACYYSLRQIYSARLTLFGLVDILVVTIFCGSVSGRMNCPLSELLVQFLFPMVVTACICFGTLCSKYHFSELTAIGMSIIWSVLWSVFVLNKTLYAAITLPVWMILFGSAVVLLFVMIYRTIRNCNDYWEVNVYGIEN